MQFVKSFAWIIGSSMLYFDIYLFIHRTHNYKFLSRFFYMSSVKCWNLMQGVTYYVIPESECISSIYLGIYHLSDIYNPHRKLLIDRLNVLWDHWSQNQSMIIGLTLTKLTRSPLQCMLYLYYLGSYSCERIKFQGFSRTFLFLNLKSYISRTTLCDTWMVSTIITL